MKLPGSLQGRLMALLLPGLVLLWAAVALVSYFETEHELDELLDSHLAQAAALLVVQQLAELEEHDEDHHHGRTVPPPAAQGYSSRTAFQVWHKGQLSLRSSNAPSAPMATHKTGFETLRLSGERWRVFATQGAEHDVLVYVGEQTDSRDDILEAVLRSLLVPAALALPLLALAGWWSVRWGLAPLRALSGQLRQRQPQALQPVAVADAPTEMAPLLEALNQLFGRIATLIEHERRFTADAAHELRTPIAAIRTQAQVALGAVVDEERRHALLQTLAGCDRATHLVQQLLTLSRLEGQAVVGAGSPVVDLAVLARQVAADLGRGALAHRQQLELDAPAPCPVRGDEALLGVLLRNLLDNALRYSPDGAPVRLSLTRDAAGTRLQLEDGGPGLADADQARLGERFFRVLGTGADGSGLGWSIVRRIAATQGASITTGRSASLGGLAVNVHWPSAVTVVS
ncbi:signal transduction histidine kinase [Burkholderiales bacterium JOSHI_001]|nr:signal transduction histidine kinase [Burkholderiales bacterium JOSHI_001]